MRYWTINSTSTTPPRAYLTLLSAGGWVGNIFFAHFDDFACQGGLVALGGEDFGADAVEGRLNFGCAADEAGGG